jgi:hypothetical protein
MFAIPNPLNQATMAMAKSSPPPLPPSPPSNADTDFARRNIVQIINGVEKQIEMLTAIYSRVFGTLDLDLAPLPGPPESATVEQWLYALQSRVDTMEIITQSLTRL